MTKNKEWSTKNAKILIVEDSRTQLIHLQYILEKESYITAVAENGKQALEALETFKPDVILSDIIMPEMDGYELCRTINANKRWENIPIILLTALTDPQDIIKGLNVGADNFIPKPFTDEFLLSKIKNLLINKEMRMNKKFQKNNEIFYAGKMHTINSDQQQTIDLLLSTYENAVNKNSDLLRSNLQLSRLKEDLEQKNNQLESLNEEKNHFIGIAAHDIRNPLGVIYNFTDLLKYELQDNTNENISKFLDFIESSTELLLNLVTELLDVSKIESGKLVLSLKEQDIIESIKQNIIKNSYLADKKKIKITSEFENERLLVNFDANRLNQVLNNFITNAIKYSNPETNIRIFVGIKNKSLHFSIIDQGVGIPSEELDQLFKPFSKTSAQTTAGEKSTGLGLFTCHKIIEAHKGTIGVESKLGKGSTFFFTLPLERDQIPEKKKSVIFDENAILEGKKILLVDDIKMNHTYFKGALGKYPITLEWVEDGESAIKACNENNYDLILMDIHLPGINGLEATREIRKNNQITPIIGQTAYLMDGMEDKCLQAGCNDYMAMPIRPKEIISKILQNIN